MTFQSTVSYGGEVMRRLPPRAVYSLLSPDPYPRRELEAAMSQPRPSRQPCRPLGWQPGPPGYPPPPGYGAPPPPPGWGSGGTPPPPPGWGPPPAGYSPQPGIGGQPIQFSVGAAFSWAWKNFTKHAGALIVSALVYGAVLVGIYAVVVVAFGCADTTSSSPACRRRGHLDLYLPKASGRSGD